MNAGWRSVLAVAGWQTAASLCYYSLFAATSYFRGTFGVSRTLVGVLVTVATLGYTLNLFPSGAAVDGFGEKRVMLLGLGGLAVAAGLLGVAPTFAALLGVAFLLGAFYATAMPASNRGIVTSAPPGRENFAMGLKQVGVTVGSGTASLAIAAVASVAAWQWGFGVVAGAAAAYVAVFAVTYSGAGSAGAWSLPDVGSLRGNRAYLLLVAAGLFIGAGVFTTTGYTLLYVDEAVGTSPAVAGVVLAGTQAAGSAGRLGAGALADRLGGGRGAATVTAVQTAVGGLLLVALALGTPPLPVAVALLLGIGVTVLGSAGVFYSCLAALVGEGEIGAATAGGQTAANVGGLLAPPLFGYLADTAGYGAGWAMLAGCMALVVVVLVAVRRLA
ncbi:MFS transporter [Halorarius halobius]|uniref:MFS transporter n=1 Tax=Halorarius halobius TaxID=2962671 RepID=UPI0020CCB7E3|nr:MFS transporter [Halorarius halobius]